MAEKIAGAALAGSIWTPDMAQYHDMSEDKPKQHERVSSIMKELAQRSRQKATSFEQVNPVQVEKAPVIDYNPHKRQDVEKAKQRQTEAEALEAKEQQERENLDSQKTTMLERGLKIGQKAEKSDHVPTREEVVPDLETIKKDSAGNKDSREIAKTLSKPAHHNMSREDRIAAAEAKLGDRLEAIKAYVERGEEE